MSAISVSKQERIPSGVFADSTFGLGDLLIAVSNRINAKYAPSRRLTMSPLNVNAAEHPLNPLSKRLRRYHNPECSGCIVGIYVTTNEEGMLHVREILTRTPRVPEGCHIGFSGMHNFDIIASRRSAYGLICDFNPDNKIFIEKALEILPTTSTRNEFVRKLIAFAREANNSRSKKQIRFSYNVSRDCMSIDREIYSELKQEGSWLFCDETFEYIRTLAKVDQIVAIAIDIRDAERFRGIADLLQNNSIQVDTLYISNIESYMRSKEDKEAFYATVHALIEGETLVISAPARDLVQRVVLGRDWQPI